MILVLPIVLITKLSDSILLMANSCLDRLV